MKNTKCDIVTGHMTQSQESHAHMIQGNNIEEFRKIMS